MIDLSAKSALRVYLLTILGTIVCIVLAFSIDAYSKGWRLDGFWLNSVLIPLVIAPPFFFFLLTNLRELSLAHEELSLAHEQLLRLASRDPLTNCLNRRAFSASIESYMEKPAHFYSGHKGALLLLDVDNFKIVNDLFGHDEGDRALQLIAETVHLSVRDTDLVARLGGEEFGVFLPGTDDLSSHATAERIRKAVEDTWFAPEGERHPLSLSIGGVVFDPPAPYLDLYRTADRRLYDAKDSGRNRVYIGGPVIGTIGWSKSRLSPPNPG